MNCINSPNDFCIMCGEYLPFNKRNALSNLIETRFIECFNITLDSLKHPWVPKTMCYTCINRLRRWRQGNIYGKFFSSPMIWREPVDHKNDCFFLFM